MYRAVWRGTQNDRRGENMQLMKLHFLTHRGAKREIIIIESLLQNEV